MPTTYGTVDPNTVPKAPSTLGLIDAAAPAQAAEIKAPTQWNVGEDQTVAGQVKGLIDQYSPLMQRAAAGANETSNARGLLNTSMAVGDAQGAVMDRALQIATPDAQIKANAAQFNAGSQNTVDLNQANLNTNVSQSNSAQEQTRLAQQTLNRVDLGKQEMQNAFTAIMQNADAQTRGYLTQLQGTVSENLANIEAQYKSLMQVSQSASTSLDNTMRTIAAIVADPNMDAASKQNAVDLQMQGLQAGMTVLASVNGIPELASLLKAEWV